MIGAQFLEKARALRPFYFIVVCWGEKYTDFLCNLCIPALLAPGNIPALANRRDGTHNKFLIATTDEDWARMEARPVFRALRAYVEPVKITIPPPPEGLSACIHMGLGHKFATQTAFEARAYAVLLTPDLMVSDGTMAAAQRHAVEGKQVVLTAALRFGEEPLFENLKAIGLPGPDDRLGDRALPLVATGRQFVDAGLKSFHSETLRYRWDVPYFSAFPVACWWPVPGENGIVVHCLSWAPLLVDYDAVVHHDSSMMDNWTIDGDYVYRNFGDSDKIYICQDSDEMMLVSWAPLADREQSLEPRKGMSSRLLGDWLRGVVLYETYYNAVFDPLKRRIFFMPVRWHANDLNGVWRAVEQRSIRILERYLAPSFAGRRQAADRLLNAWIRTRGLLVRGAWFVVYYWRNRGKIIGLIFGALTGDGVARQRVRRGYRYFMHVVFGRPLGND